MPTILPHIAVPMMAKGVMMLKKDMNIESIDDCPYLQDFLDR